MRCLKHFTLSNGTLKGSRVLLIIQVKCVGGYDTSYKHNREKTKEN